VGVQSYRGRGERVGGTGCESAVLYGAGRERVTANGCVSAVYGGAGRRVRGNCCVNAIVHGCAPKSRVTSTLCVLMVCVLMACG
jgi:hypothetical protein